MQSLTTPMQHLDLYEIKCSLFIDIKVHFLCVQPGYEKINKNVDVRKIGRFLFLSLHNLETQIYIANLTFD